MLVNIDGQNNNMEDKINFDFFSIRTINCLQTACLYTNKKLSEISQEELLRLPNFGIKCLKEVREYLLILKSDSSFPNNHLDFYSLAVPGSFGRSINIINQEILDEPINKDMFSARVYKRLKKLKIKRINDLVRAKPRDFSEGWSFGKHSLSNILKVISEMDKQCSMLKDMQNGQLKKINAFYIVKNLIISICPDFKLDIKSIKRYIPKSLSVNNCAINEMIKYFDNYLFLIPTWNDSKARLFNSIINKTQDRHMLIFKSRMANIENPSTLKEISDKLSLTRERVRQLCVGITKNLNKYFFKKMISIYFENYINFVRENGGLITEREFMMFAIKEDQFINKDILKLIICAYNNIYDNNIYLLNISDVNYISEFSQEDLNNAYNELMDECENLYGLTKEQMREFLKLDESYSQAVEDACINLFIKNEAIFRKGKLIGIKNKTSLNFAYLVKSFNNGAHFKIIIETYSLYFNNGMYQGSVRGYFDRFENVILWGRGVYIHIDNINVNFDELYRVYEKIHDATRNIENKTSVSYIFHSNQALMKYLNIPSAQALYSILRMDNVDEFIYRRYPDIEKYENLKRDRKEHAKEIDSFFLDASKEIFWSQLESYFINKRGFVAYQVTNLIAQSKNIYRLGVGRWIHIEHLNINKKDIQKIISTLRKKFNNEKYLLVGDLLKKLQLPSISPFHWNRDILSSIIRKNSDYKVISNIAVVSLEVDTLKITEDLVLDIVKTSNFKFTRDSLEMFLRTKKISTNMNFLVDFVNKYGHLLED